MAKERTPEQQAMMDKMDAAATEARLEMQALADEAAQSDVVARVTGAQVVEWWNKWYPKAGHKRLGKILVGLSL